jgi:hypothetical protein
MKSLIALALAVAGCTDDPGFDHPINVPTSGTATGGTSSARVTGRVCVLADPQLLNACAIRGASGLTVVAAGATTATTTTTGADGSFVLTAPAPITVGTLTVSGSTVVTSTQAIGGANVVPVMTQALFADMTLATGVTPLAGTGTILSTVVARGVPVTGAVATSTPSPAFGPFFDGTQPAPWTLNATGARGIVLFPGVVAGSASLTFRSNDLETTVDGVQVVDGGLTFADAVLP